MTNTPTPPAPLSEEELAALRHKLSDTKYWFEQPAMERRLLATIDSQAAALRERAEVPAGSYPKEWRAVLREAMTAPRRSEKPSLASEIYRAFKNLDAPVDLLAIIGSFRDTLSDAEIAELLKEYNDTGNYMHGMQ